MSSLPAAHHGLPWPAVILLALATWAALLLLMLALDGVRHGGRPGPAAPPSAPPVQPRDTKPYSDSGIVLADTTDPQGDAE
jgi:hypothetical protein